MLDFTALEEALRKETDAGTSAAILLNALTEAIRTISAGISDPATQQKLNSLADATSKQTAILTAAVVANTPADTTGKTRK